MTKIESKVVEAWRKAADDLGIRFSSPFACTTRGQQIEGIGFVHHFGRRIGTIISVLGQPSSLVHLTTKRQEDKDYFISVLSKGYGEYNRQSFIDTLNDWQFFGAESERPSWYSGKYWGQK